MPKKSSRSKSQRPQNKTKKSELKKEVPAVALASVPNVLKIAGSSWAILWRNKKTLSLIIIIYGLAYLVLVLGLSSPANVSSLKSEFSGAFHGHLGSLFSSLSILSYLVSSTGSSSAAGSAYQVFIIIVASLAIIWSLRQFYLLTKVRARDSYYQGLFPLAQFILVLLFIALELIPLAIGLALFSYLIDGNIAVTALEKILFLIPIIGLVGLSFYLISSSLMALYIVTLPNMTPLKALRSAKGLVKGRRWSVFRKIIFLPLLLFVVIAVIIVPFIFIAAGLAAWLFFILSLVALVYIHSYLYGLYRGLINEQD